MQNIQIHHQKVSTGCINQIADPLQKGDIVEVINKYYDPTVIGEWIYSVRLLKSSNQELVKYELNGIRLVACYKVDIISSH